MTDNEIFKCDQCEERFLKCKIDPHDELDFDHIIQFDGVICKGCIYKLLMEYYREKVWASENIAKGNRYID